VTLEWRPGSVRLAGSGSSTACGRTDDSGCPKVAEEGNVISMRHKGMHLTARTRDRACLRDASFARSFDPCSSILTTLCGESFGGEALESVSRLGKLAKARGTNTGTGLNGRNAACHVSPLCFRKETGRRDASRKGRRSRPPSLRGLKSSGLVARTSNCSCRSR
jgi:hypothetical protein